MEQAVLYLLDQGHKIEDIADRSGLRVDAVERAILNALERPFGAASPE